VAKEQIPLAVDVLIGEANLVANGYVFENNLPHFFGQGKP
jgi:hypothetical protein